MIKHFCHLLLSCFLPAFLSAQIPELIVQQEGHATEAKLVCFSPDDRQALSADEKRLILWDLNSGKFVRGIPIVASPRLISFSASGQEALALLEDASLNSWDLNTGKLLWKVILPVNKYFPNGTYDNGNIWVSDIESIEVYSLMISPDRRCMVATYNQDKVACWDLQDGHLRWSHKVKKAATGILLFGPEDHTVRIFKNDGSFLQGWDTESGKKKAAPDLNRWPGDFTGLENTALVHRHTLTELNDFQQNFQKCLLALEQDEKVLNLPVVDFAFSANGKILAVGLGSTTLFTAFSPDIPFKESGHGGLILWNVEKDQLIMFHDSLPEMINQVDLSNDGNLLLTASSDQTMRLWDVPTGKEKFRMQRGLAMETNIQFSADFKQMVMSRADGILSRWELNQRNELVVQKLPVDNFALSPDGSQILRANRKGELFRDTFPFENQRKTTLEDQHFCLEITTALAFSKDGKKVLAGSAKEGRVLYRTAPITPVSEVLNFVTDEKGDTIGFVSRLSKIIKTPEGLFETILDTLTLYGACSVSNSDPKHFLFTPDKHNISLWDLEKERSIKVFDANHQETSAVGFSPDESMVCATVRDKKKAWNIQSGKRLRNEKGYDYFHAIAWDTLSARAATILEDRKGISIWTLADGRIRHTIQSPSRLLAVALDPNGSHICGLTEDGHLTEWDEQKEVMVRQISGISTEALIEFSLDSSRQIYPWSLLQYAPDPDYMLVRSLMTTEMFHLPTGKSVIKFGVPAYTGGLFFEGRRGGQISSLKFLPDGKRILVTFYDGTIQCWNYKTGGLVFTVYFRGDKDWVVSTPSGLFDASPGAMNLLYFVLGREVIDLDQIKERYYQPALLPMLMGFVDGEIREVREFRNLPMFPEIRFSINGNLLSVQLTPRQGALGKLSLFVNGKQVAEDINLERLTDIKQDLSRYAKFYRSDTTNTIALRAYNAEGWLKSQVYEMNYTPVYSKGEDNEDTTPPSCGEVKPSLYLLVIGTSRYTDASKSLSFPDVDASEMAKALRNTGERLFGDQVCLKLLSTAGDSVIISSRANIEAAFREVAQKASPCDVVVAYFSGHGANWGKNADKSNFYYLTKDITTAKLSDPEIRASYAISDEDLTKWLAAIPAQKQVLILDACNSGKAAEIMSGTRERDFNPDQVIAFELLKDKTGTFILTGSTADMASFESNQYGQGLLTYSLLQGMSGTALKEGKFIDIMTLFQSSRTLVPKLAQSIKKVQTPVIAAPKGASSFPIGIKDESVKIEVAQLKPVVIWSYFQDREQFNDPIGLSEAINNFFHGQAVKGAQAKYVYYDIPKYMDGYSIHGNYTIGGETVSLSGKLFKGDMAVSNTFQLKGGKDPAEWVKLILAQVLPLIK